MIEHDPDALRRRLARYFDTIPHLAFVAAESSATWGAATLVVGINYYRDGELIDFGRRMKRYRKVRRLVMRAARLLGAHSITSNPDTMGPNSWETVIYTRQTLPCWAPWTEEMERYRRHSQERRATTAAAYAGWSPTHRISAKAVEFLRANGVAVDADALRARARGIARRGEPPLMEVDLPPRKPRSMADLRACASRSAGSIALTALMKADPRGSGLRWFEWEPYDGGPSP